MTTVAITFVLGAICVATFLLQGKQWPTFITSTIFGLYLGSTTLGTWTMGQVNAVFDWLGGMLS